MYRSSILYRVRTVVASVPLDIGWYTDVPIVWYVADRESPVIPYWHAIMDYSVLSISAKERVERALNELFTADEAEQFIGFLGKVKNGNDSVLLEEQILPLHSSELVSLGESYQDDTRGSYFHIRTTEEYRLPFQVTGKAELGTLCPRNTAPVSLQTQ